MTALSIAQTVCARIGLPLPTSAVGSTDTQVLQVVALINQEGLELAQRPSYGWTFLQAEASFTTLAAESQGAIATLAPGLRFIVNDTIWNRTLIRPIFGPLSPQRWQQLKASNVSGPWNQYRIRGANLIFIPIPAAGQNCYFEYASNNWCTDTTGAIPRSAFLQDTDLCLFSEELVTLGATWRWKSAKGLPYAEDFNTYEKQVIDAMARDGSKDILDMGGDRYTRMPGIGVPDGSWSL